jgi:hypothetical protein
VGVVGVAFLLGPHPSHEGRGSRPGGWVRLGSNSLRVSGKVVVEENEPKSTVMRLMAVLNSALAP